MTKKNSLELDEVKLQISFLNTHLHLFKDEGTADQTSSWSLNNGDDNNKRCRRRGRRLTLTSIFGKALKSILENLKLAI